MKIVTDYKKNNFHTTSIDLIYQFKCKNDELIALEFLKILLLKSSNKYKEQDIYKKEVLKRYILYLGVGGTYINHVCLLNISMTIPNEGLVKDFDITQAIEIMLDSVYQNNLNDEKIFDIEKKNYIEFLLDLYKDIDFIASKNAKDLIDSDGLFNTLKYEDLDYIKNIKIDDVIRFYKKYIEKRLPYIFINGDLNINKVDNYFYDYLSKLKLKSNTLITDYNATYKKYNLVIKKEKSHFYQSALIYAYTFKKYKDDDYYKLFLLNELLGENTNSLLIELLRKKSNLVYSAYSSVLLKNGIIFINTMTSKDNIILVKKIINGIINDLHNIKNYGDRISNIKNNYEKNSKRDLDSFYKVVGDSIKKYFNTSKTSSEILEGIKSVTIEELEEFISRMVPILKYEIEGDK